MLYRSHTAGSYLDRAPGRPFRKQNGIQDGGAANTRLVGVSFYPIILLHNACISQSSLISKTYNRFLHA